MSAFRKPALALAYAVTLATAQTSNTSSPSSCPGPIMNINNGRANFNSTGSRPIKLTPNQDDQFYLTYAVTDERGENINVGPWATMQRLSVYVSVPGSLIGSQQGNDTNFCMYMMPGQNETVTYSGDDASRSCDGVLTDECLTALRSTPLPTEDDCPQANVRDECGWNTGVGRAAPSNFSDPSCTVESIPHVDLPNGYRTYGGFVGTGLLPPDSERDSFEVYDLRVRQPIPMLITSRVGNSSEGQAEVICLAPDRIVDGSRQPEGDFPSSSVMSFGVGARTLPACLVAAVAALVSRVAWS